MSVRVAVVISHPIQHFCPQYASWSRLPGIELKVFFAARIGMEAYYDPDFGQEVQWKGLALDFEHEFLPGAAERKSSANIEAEGLDDALSAFRPDLVIAYGYSVPLQRRAIRWAKANDAEAGNDLGRRAAHAAACVEAGGQAADRPANGLRSPMRF